MASANFLTFEIVSPQGIIFSDEVNSVTLPTYNGEITILPNHTSLFTKLSDGEIVARKDNKELTFVVAGGFLEVKANSAHVLSDHAIRAESIEVAKAEERKRLAQDRLKQKLENEDFTMADKDLKLSILELKVAEKMRRKRSA